MHPDILRELVSQHGRELREQAHRATLARTAGRARRAGRFSAGRFSAGRFSAGRFSAGRFSAGRHSAANLAAEAAGPVIPAIPDYVDGSFRAARDEVAGRVPAARQAA